eukprot:scaffold1696_cov258-Pinguiococcus_pyrenoidosus.AAC.10
MDELLHATSQLAQLRRQVTVLRIHLDKLCQDILQRREGTRGGHLLRAPCRVHLQRGLEIQPQRSGSGAAQPGLYDKGSVELLVGPDRLVAIVEQDAIEREVRVGPDAVQGVDDSGARQ